MVDLTTIEEHPAIKELTDVLCIKTSNNARSFFKMIVSYFIAKVASCMRTTIKTQDRGSIPVNMYTVALSPSGAGKGHSVNVMEEEVLGAFKQRFTKDTFEIIALESLKDLALNQQSKYPDMSLDQVESHLATKFKAFGPYPFTFDSGTAAALKQIREMLLYAKIGAISYQCDELGSNLLGAGELLNSYLELYDKGLIKIKLIKQTKESSRSEDIDGYTPTNMLLFGTPTKVFDGSTTEQSFIDYLETGYARRCLFGYAQIDKKAYQTMTAEEVFDQLTSPECENLIKKWSSIFYKLADPLKANWQLDISRDVNIKLVDYKLACDRKADLLPEHKAIQKAELSHRYFKALKLAGALAFIDEASEIDETHLYQAIKVVEESGECFDKIMVRDTNYMKLAKFIASTTEPLTHADLNEQLPFYTQSNVARNELMNLAQAWGYRQHIIITKQIIDNIEFFKGETLELADINKCIFSYNLTECADDYVTDLSAETCPFKDLHLLTQAKDRHWCNHQFKNNYRKEENVIKGFNMIVLDVDEGVTLAQAQELLKKYTFMTYTTKRHTEDHNRFRLVMPIKYKLYLDAEEYKGFMSNVLKWLPFKVDQSVLQRSHKWRSFDRGTYSYNEGEILDVLNFIPFTRKNEEFQKKYIKNSNLEPLQRWFLNSMEEGNRNNQMIKYAFMLCDSGYSEEDVKKEVMTLNNNLQEPLSKQELNSTIFKTISKRFKEGD